MHQVFDQHKENLRKMVFSGQSNALSAAAPLTKDDGIPQRPRQMQQEASKSANTQPSRTPTGPKRPIVQKIAFISALLTVGAIRQAVCLISRFPWVVDSHTEISDLLLRILQASLKPSFELHLPHDPEVAAQNSMPRQRWSPSGLVAPLPLKASLTVFAPEPTATTSTFFVFFYPAWSRGVPLCKNDHDMQKILEPLVAMLGLQIHRDLNFFTKLCQLARIQLSQKVCKPALHSLNVDILHSRLTLNCNRCGIGY
jgi:THO complex subunit 2